MIVVIGLEIHLSYHCPGASVLRDEASLEEMDALWDEAKRKP